MRLQEVYPQPAWNTPDSVSKALEAVSNASDKESSQSAYNKLLYAVGNNHAGTYYPVALSIITEIEAIMRSGEMWPQHTVIEAMIDLFISFEPEPGQEVFCERSLSVDLRQQVIGLKPYYVHIAGGTGVAAASAKDILRHISDEENSGSGA